MLEKIKRIISGDFESDRRKALFLAELYRHYYNSAVSIEKAGWRLYEFDAGNGIRFVRHAKDFDWYSKQLRSFIEDRYLSTKYAGL